LLQGDQLGLLLARLVGIMAVQSANLATSVLLLLAVAVSVARQ